MTAPRAAWLALRDFWEEFLLVAVVGPVGTLLSLLVIPLPFVLAGHYATASRVAEGRAVSWRDWWVTAREHALFFYKWFALLLVVGLVLLANVVFYRGVATDWALFMQWIFTGFLFLWISFQPYVPACYFEQSDLRLRVSLRNAAIIAVADPLSLLAFWLLALPLALISLAFPPLLLLAPLFLIMVSTRIVKQSIRRYSGRRQEDNDEYEE
jgi:uncharacterized membrane protein YesL